MMKPLNEFLIVKVDIDDKKKEVNGLIIPDTAKKKPYIGTVIEVSEEIKDAIKKGDKVVWPAMLGVEINVEGNDYTVLKKEDVLMLLK